MLAGAGAGIRVLYQRGEARKQALQEQLFEPYWSAIAEGDVQKAAGYRTPAWRAANAPSAIAEAYAAAQAEHGALRESTVHSAQGYSEPGLAGQALKVKCIFVFEGGLNAVVTYDLHRATEQDPWRIGATHTEQRLGLGAL